MKETKQGANPDLNTTKRKKEHTVREDRRRKRETDRQTDGVAHTHYL